MVMVPGHTHGCLRDLTHSEVLKHLLLGCRCHCDRLLLRCATGLHLLIFSGDLLLLHRDSLFHSCWRQRFSLQCLALIQEIRIPAVHRFLFLKFLVYYEDRMVRLSLSE